MKLTGLLILFILPIGLLAQEYTISGRVVDQNSKESLIGANIFVPSIGKGTATNDQGFYSLSLPEGSYELIYSYVGYEIDTFTFEFTKDQLFNVELSSATTLDVVEVVDEKINTINGKVQMSSVTIPMAQIKSLPSFMGEVDILRSLQLMPGIQSAGELQSGILVRGGSRDQNLIILDGVPVYNVSHVLGLFSVFNADAIKNVDVIKGGFPARYGGRLSSVVEMNLKDGHRKEFHGAGSIGLITSKLMLEGPVNSKSSFLISGRRTYIDLLIRPLIRSEEVSGESIKPKLHFYDLNFKYNYEINDRNRLFLSWYNGKDVFRTKYEYNGDNYREEIEAGPDWGNQIAALRWNSQLGKKTFANTRLIYSKYDMEFIGDFKSESDGFEEEYKINYLSGIEDIGIRSSIDYAHSPDHYIRAGVSTTYHRYTPGVNSQSYTSSNEPGESSTVGAELYALESNVYLEDEFRRNNWSGNVGIHFSHFNSDETNYFSLEPRLSLKYDLSKTASIKASYARMRQYINLLSSETLTLPSDFWVPSTKNISPQLSHQWAIGYARDIRSKFEFSAEAYYKTMDQVVSYKEGESFFVSGLNTALNWEDKITQGEGEAYGLELLLQKKQGRFTGWFGYTLSWNWRQFDEINDGKRFLFRNDRRHDVSIVGNYDLSDKVKLSASWIYQTGISVSIPQGYFRDRSSSYSELLGFYSQKNDYKLSPTHRLDMAIEFHKKKRRYERAWVISVYNVYGYVSPFFLTRAFVGGEEKLVEAGILPIIPSISYKFNF